MPASEPAPSLNLLYRVAAGSGAILTLFLLVGAWGHFAAIWPRLTGPEAASTDRILLILPGAVLLLCGLANLATLYGLWRSGKISVVLALLINVGAAGYFAYLLARGVPDHPIGLFLALVAGHTVLLGSLQAGLRWPVL